MTNKEKRGLAGLKESLTVKRERSGKGRGHSGNVGAITRRNAGSLRALVLVLGGCFLLGMLPELKAQLVPPASRLTTSSYQDLVNDLIANNLLKLSEDGERVEVNPIGVAQFVGSGGPSGKDACSATKGSAERLRTAASACDAALTAMADKTFLKVDMANAASPVWHYDDSQLLAGLAQGARHLAVARVAGVGRQPQLRLAPAPARFVLEGFVIEASVDRRTVRTVRAVLGDGSMQSYPLTQIAGGTRYDPDQPPAVLCLPFGPNRAGCLDEIAVIRLGPLGLFLWIPSGVGTDPQNGASPTRAIKIGERVIEIGESPAIEQLRAGEYVEVRWKDYELQFQIVDRKRQFGDLPGMAGIEAAVFASRPRGVVQTTIQSDVHLAGQKALDELEVLTDGRDVSVRASVTFMDGWTGEIVGLPTFPHREDQLGKGEAERRFRQDWLAENMAFNPMVVGSVAKVLFAAPLLKNYPELGRMKYTAPSPGNIDRVEGEALTSGGQMVEVENLHGTTEFNFQQFITKSNNYFALAMMKYGSGPESRPGVEKWAEDFWGFNCAVASKVTRLPDDPDRFGDWFAKGKCSRSLWPDIESSRPNALAAAELSPFSFNLENAVMATNNFPDYYINVLGSGKSLWSTIALAQAFSRIVTQREVSARFTSVNDGFSSRPLFEEEGNWQKPLLDGMTGVVLGEGGSANKLAYFFKKGGDYDHFHIFAKTGTFKLETSAAANRYRCIWSYLRAGGALKVKDDFRLQAASRPANCDIGKDLAAVAADPDDRAAFTALENEETGLIRTMPSLTTLTPGNGNALVLVFKCKKKEQHIRTIAINVQARKDGAQRADISYARTILEAQPLQNWIKSGCPS